jgi:hypothetical protein
MTFTRGLEDKKKTLLLRSVEIEKYTGGPMIYVITN